MPRALQIDASKLRKLCDERALTMREVADRAQLSTRTVHHAMKGNRLSLRSIRLIAEALDVPMPDLLVDDAQSEPSKADAVAVSTDRVGIELTINADFDSFSDEDQKRVLAALKELLDVKGDVRVIQIRPGSTKLSIDLSRDEAECLLWLQRRGLLDEYLAKHKAHFKIQDTKLIGDAAAAAIIEAKLENNEFDVFLCHNSQDKKDVMKIAVELRQHGLLPWLDAWELRPGLTWQDALQQQVEDVKSVAVFVGNGGLGPWQDLEIKAFLSQLVKRGCPVIPVILRKCKTIPKMPAFLKEMTWVNFKKRKPDPTDQLIWGITGVKSRTTTEDFLTK